ncbi:MAG TPA: hypothetical protein PKI46_09080, partial [Bacteroidales bacterium]|nr:hypothetical protein [Bacteroidales bacterium]
MPAGYYGLSGTSFTNYDHKAGIILRAINDDTLDPNGIYLARIPNRGSVTLFEPFDYNGSASVINNYYENYNEVYRCTTGGNHNIDPAEDITNFIFIYKDEDTYYNTEIQKCKYDIVNNFIYSRSDLRNNIVTNVNYTALSNEMIKKSFRWGSDNFINNTVNIIDTSVRRIIGILPYRRDPDFQNANYINYSNISVMTNNRIDTNISNDITASCTQFYDNYLYGSILIGNVIDNSRIFKLRPDSGFGLSFSNNNIKRSALVNLNIVNLIDNNIEDSMMGDVYYTNSDGTSSNNTVFKDINTVFYSSVFNKYSSKNWSVVSGALGDLDTVGPFMNTDGVLHYLDAGDIIYMTSGGLSGNTYVISNAPTTTTANFTTTPSGSFLNAPFGF